MDIFRTWCMWLLGKCSVFYLSPWDFPDGKTKVNWLHCQSGMGMCIMRQPLGLDWIGGRSKRSNMWRRTPRLGWPCNAAMTMGPHGHWALKQHECPLIHQHLFSWRFWATNNPLKELSRSSCSIGVKTNVGILSQNPASGLESRTNEALCTFYLPIQSWCNFNPNVNIFSHPQMLVNRNSSSRLFDASDLQSLEPVNQWICFNTVENTSPWV